MARDLSVDEIMAILPETPGGSPTLTKGLTPAQLRTAPEAGAWSVNDVLAHLRACHDVLGGNVLRILAEDHPALKGMNPRAWMKKTDYPEWQFAPAFAVFRKQRAELLAVLEPLPAGRLGAHRDGDRDGRRDLRAERPLLRRLDGRPRAGTLEAHRADRRRARARQRRRSGSRIPDRIRQEPRRRVAAWPT